MEITKVSETALKIKGKHATCMINPFDLRTKINTVCAIFFERLNEPLDMKYFENEPLIIQGAGEYAIGGIKIVGTTIGDVFLYKVIIDNIVIFVAKASMLTKAKESASEYNILLLESDILLDQSSIMALDPKVVVFYGEHKEANAKTLGKLAETVTKYTLTKEKIPTEMEVFLLG